MATTPYGDVIYAGSFQTAALILADGSITDTSGAISFGNENLSTTGYSRLDGGVGIGADVTARFMLNLSVSQASDMGMQIINSNTAGSQELVMGRAAGEQFVFGVYNSAYATAAWRKAFVMQSDSGMTGGMQYYSNAQMLFDVRDRTSGVSPPHWYWKANGAARMDLDYSGNLVVAGNITTTAGEVIGPKAKMTAIGGFAILLTNTTGAATVAGQLVEADPATDDAVVLTGVDAVDCIGVFLDTGVADDAEAWVVVAGIADVAFDDAFGPARGDWVETSEAGYAHSQASPAASPIHFGEIGHCIETVAAGAGGTHVLARCVLHFN